jgi:hypothetical protein
MCLAVTLGGSGCAGYWSSYVPPDDGYARLVWQGTSVVAVGGTGLAGCDAVPSPPVELLGPPVRLSIGVGTSSDPWLAFVQEVAESRDGEDDDDEDEKKGGKALAVVLMAAATVIVAAAAAGVAAAPAGRPSEIARAIDAVNRHNAHVAWKHALCVQEEQF